MFIRITVAAVTILLAALSASGQVTIDGSCRGRIFRASEVTKRARILEGPSLNTGPDRLKPGTRFVIDAVLCRSGHVTDIRVIESTSPELNEFARAAVYLLKFEPAEYQWHSVSQRMQFELNFGPGEARVQVRTSTDATGSLVESVEIIGNRRLTPRQILFWIETRPGDSYSEERLKRDLNAVLASGYFDKTQTRVTIENAVRGGIAVAFFVVELPLIGEINFEGSKIDRSAIIEALKKESVLLQPESPYDDASVKRAVRIIKDLLASARHGDFNVETRTEYVTAQKVNITFVITPNQ